MVFAVIVLTQDTLASSSCSSYFTDMSLAIPSAHDTQRRPRHNSAPGYSSVKDDAKPGETSSSLAIIVTSSGLDALRSILEATNTLPCIKYITQISITLLKIIEVGTYGIFSAAYSSMCVGSSSDE